MVVTRCRMRARTIVLFFMCAVVGGCLQCLHVRGTPPLYRLAKRTMRVAYHVMKIYGCMLARGQFDFKSCENTQT